ncbi:MAG: sensor histidine kinase [Rhodocyclaceae bacterium]
MRASRPGSRRGLPLTRRILLAFVAMSAVVSGAFAVLVLVTMEYTEDRIASMALERELNARILGTDAGPMAAADTPDAMFYRLDDEAWADRRHAPSHIPAWIRDLGAGFHEVEIGDTTYHALVRPRDGGRDVLVVDQSDFERRETVLRLIVAAAFGASLMFALALGAALARKVIAPVRELAERVGRGNGDPPQPLAPAFADDEIGRLAASFDQALGRLHAALSRERLFASDLSHELRNPLMVIASTCEVLLESQAAGDPACPRIARIARAAEDMREITTALLALARDDEHTGLPLAPLADVAAAQVERWLPLARARGLALHCRVEQTDPGRYPSALLATVCGNLLRNALHYTDYGFVDLVVRSGGFSVIDSGPGIPPGQQDLLLRPFVRGEQARGDGIGLGLSLVDRICRSQGWQLTLTNRPEGGCEFRVTLPPSKPSVPAAPSDPADRP